MNRKYFSATWLWAGLFSCAFAGVELLGPHPRVLWNASASALIGLYRVKANAVPALGDLVVLMPPPDIARFIAERRYLPGGVPLLKRVAALPGQRVCRTGAIVSIDAVAVATARARDRVGRKMPDWQGCQRISPGRLFLLNPAADSLDGRYFGPVPASLVAGIAHPVLTRNGPGEPLRWQRDNKPVPSTPTAKEHHR